MKSIAHPLSIDNPPFLQENSDPSSITFQKSQPPPAINNGGVDTVSMNMDIWVVGALNETFIGSSHTETKFSKKKKSDKTLFFMIGPYGSPFSICPNIGF